MKIQPIDALDSRTSLWNQGIPDQSVLSFPPDIATQGHTKTTFGRKMKISIITALILIAAMSVSWAGPTMIKVVTHYSQGEPEDIGSVSAKDDATGAEILKFWKEAKKAFPEGRRDFYGPDSGYIEITITNGEEKIVVRSWHPLFEKNPKLVVTSRGVESLDGRNREEVLKADEAWYREARRVFDGIVTFAKSKKQNKP